MSAICNIKNFISRIQLIDWEDRSNSIYFKQELIRKRIELTDEYNKISENLPELISSSENFARTLQFIEHLLNIVNRFLNNTQPK